MIIITPSSWKTSITYNKTIVKSFASFLQWVVVGGRVLDLLDFIHKIGIPLRRLFFFFFYNNDGHILKTNN